MCLVYNLVKKGKNKFSLSLFYFFGTYQFSDQWRGKFAKQVLCTDYYF